MLGPAEPWTDGTLEVGDGDTDRGSAFSAFGHGEIVRNKKKQKRERERRKGGESETW
jgi:hypothetical protein